MALLEGFAGRGDKSAVIFDIGRAYTKCGFAGESSPRFMVPSLIKKIKVHEDRTPAPLMSFTDKENLRELLIDFFQYFYYKCLLVNPKDRRVVVVESPLCPTLIREQIAHVLFVHFEVPSLLFAPVHLVTLFTLGIQTGLVLDSGYKETLAIPIFDGYPMVNYWQSALLASEAVHENIHRLLVEKASIRKANDDKIPFSEYKWKLPDTSLEDIKVRACFVTTIARSKQWAKYSQSNNIEDIPDLPEECFEYPIYGCGDKLIIPYQIREMASEILFEMDNELVSVPGLLLDVLLASPMDIRKSLAENIVLIGGTTHLPGFKARVKEELFHLLTLPKYSQLAIKEFKFHKSPGQPNYVGWLGGAIFGALEALPLRSISREAYIQRGEVPDWTKIQESDQSESSEYQRTFGTRK